MIPSRALIASAAAVASLGVVASLQRAALVPWAAGALAVALAAAIDALRALRDPAPEVTRHLPASFPVLSWTPVRLAVSWPGARPLAAEVFDHHPAGAEADGLPIAAVIPAGGAAVASYRLRPLERGQAAFGQSEVLIRSPWRLWRRRIFAGRPSCSRVLPDFKPLTRYALLAVDNRTSQLGVRLRPRRGAGLELLHLREYRVGDPLRQIDWKATARSLRLISREYQDERNQHVVFLIDCGRTMRAVEVAEPHFEHALRSVLLLAYVALRQGDAVGALTFGGTERWLAPVKGRGAMKIVLDSIHDLRTSTQAPDYLAAAARLVRQQRRRSLVVVISNLRDDDGSELAAALHLMTRRHLVLLASLRESVLDDGLVGPIRTFDHAVRRAALHHYLGARRRAHAALGGRGLRFCDIVPRDLPIALVNRYLDIKRSGAL